jgi:hypothetical protein
MLLPEEKSNKCKELSEMAMQDYSPLIIVLEFLNFKLVVQYYSLYLIENLFFSPVIHCIPHDLPYVIVRFIIQIFS